MWKEWRKEGTIIRIGPNAVCSARDGTRFRGSGNAKSSDYCVRAPGDACAAEDVNCSGQTKKKKKYALPVSSF